MNSNVITDALGMTKEEIDALVGKQVYVELRKPDPKYGIVTEVKTCFGDVNRCGIYVDGEPIDLDKIESIRIVNQR